MSARDIHTCTYMHTCTYVCDCKDVYIHVCECKDVICVHIIPKQPQTTKVTETPQMYQGYCLGIVRTCIHNAYTCTHVGYHETLLSCHLIHIELNIEGCDRSLNIECRCVLRVGPEGHLKPLIKTSVTTAH